MISPRDHPFLLALVIAGLVVNLGFARMGFMPLDASIVFDGGWRILSGQVPWRDFNTPYGVVPSAMQAVFFAVIGRTWLAFCLHSSVVNGAFAALLYVLLVLLRLPRPLAFFYGFCASFFFYPPVGVPFMEQHSFFFTLAAITAAVAGNYATQERTQWWLWAAVAPLALLALFSKQVPFGFAAPALPLLLLLPGPSHLRTRVTALASGVAACAVFLGLLILVLDISWSTMYEYSFVRPREVGGLRTTGASQLAERVARRYDNLPTAMGLGFIRNAAVLFWISIAAFPVMLGIWLVGRRHDAEMTGDMTRLSCALLLAPLTYVSSMLLGFVANNQTQNSVAFYPVGAALLHAALCAQLRILGRGVALVPAVTRARASSTRQLWLKRALSVAVVAISIPPVRHWTLDTVTWVNRVDMPRMVNDMTFDFARAERSAGSLPMGMEFIRWTPSPASYDLQGWTDLTVFLRERNRNFLIIGDTLVTYGLLGKPSVAPNLWFHPGLTMPEPSETTFASYEQTLMDRIRHHDVGYIVVEGNATRLGFDVDQLPRLSDWLASEWRLVHTFGRNRVYEPIGR